MLDVRIFDGNGKLKESLSHKEVVAISNTRFEKKKRGGAYGDLYRRKAKKTGKKND